LLLYNVRTYVCTSVYHSAGALGHEQMHFWEIRKRVFPDH
jgi:hypothetical protein